MHNFFTGLMGMFLGVTSFFHGSHSMPNFVNQSQATISATPSGVLQRKFGQRPFFGTVTAVSGSTLTVQLVFPGRFMRNPSLTPTLTPPAPKTITITLTSDTKYIGGTQSDIAVNTKIAGVGKVNSDRSMTAVMVRIHATMPGPGGFRQGRGMHGEGPESTTSEPTENQ